MRKTRRGGNRYGMKRGERRKRERKKKGGKREYLLETRIRREQRGRLWIIRSTTTTILKPGRLSVS